MISRRLFLQSAAVSVAYLASPINFAWAANAPGVSDTEIKIGQTMPYSGPASAYGTIGRAELAYFKMINEQGGINGRKLSLISVDDGYSPPKTVEQTRRLIEQERVAFMFGSLGTAPNAAVRSYLNENGIPQLLLASGASMFADPAHYPWTMAFNPSYRTEGRVFARYILATRPTAKIGVLYQNDDLGRDYRDGFREGVGPDKTEMIVKEVSYETSDPTVDSQIIALQNAGADTLILGATPKFAALAIRKAFDIGWTPERYAGSASASIPALKSVGLDKLTGLVTNYWGKDPNDPRWENDPERQAWSAFVAKYMTPADFGDAFAVYGASAATLLVQMLKQCGDDLSRENIMRQAADVRNFRVWMALPGATINTSPTEYRVIRQLQLARFNGVSWEWVGDLLSD
jgi:branched-chain amino acid transport system substrate-binding protein